MMYGRGSKYARLDKEAEIMKWKYKDLLDLDSLKADEIQHILQTAVPMKEILG
jgi:hypothetical protein